jgi:tRNA pseudouridine55 synthase
MNEETLLIDKPAGWTSFDVVAKIRGKIRAEYVSRGIKPTKRQLKVGHAGTLDPFATGLLIVLLGDATKKADEFLKLDKTYEFTAKLGEVSSTGDPEGIILEYEKWKMENEDKTEDIGHMAYDKREALSKSVTDTKFGELPTIDDVLSVLEQFTGEITQIPPQYSAIKINGKRAYKLAREGKSFEIPSRKVTVSKLQMTGYNYPYLKCVCDVSSGTYIRTLVEDIGKTLNTGAYCVQLRRTRIGNYQLENAQTIDKMV